MTQPVGIFDYTNDEYHASEGLSRSGLWTFKQLPYKFWYEKLSGKFVPPESKDSFLLGSLVHTMLLEPHKVPTDYIAAPELDRRTRAGKMAFEEFVIASEGKTVVPTRIMTEATAMANALGANETVHDLLQDARMEKSIYWKHEATGLLCKARPDIWQPNVVSDLKTTLDACHRGFQQSAYKYGYFLQAGMIHEAMKSIDEPFGNFVFICIEKTAPYAIGIYMLDEDSLQFGIDMFHSLMERIARCYDTNVWPDFGIQKLSIPRYATLENEIEYE